MANCWKPAWWAACARLLRSVMVTGCWCCYLPLFISRLAGQLQQPIASQPAPASHYNSGSKTLIQWFTLWACLTVQHTYHKRTSPNGQWLNSSMTAPHGPSYVCHAPCVTRQDASSPATLPSISYYPLISMLGQHLRTSEPSNCFGCNWKMLCGSCDPVSKLNWPALIPCLTLMVLLRRACPGVLPMAYISMGYKLATHKEDSERCWKHKPTSRGNVEKLTHVNWPRSFSVVDDNSSLPVTI